MAEQFDLLLLGDTAFGANYQERIAKKGRTNVLDEHGYDYGFEHVERILQCADLVVANLETPLTSRRDSPFADIRNYIHYDDPDLTLRHLLAHNIRAVTLANNHTHDMGEPGLLDTLGALQKYGLFWFGAGHDLTQAERPLRVHAEISGTAPFKASLFTRFYGGREFRDVLKAYATPESPGSAALDVTSMARSVTALRQQRPQEFIVVMPHWRRDYKWASPRQREAAEQLVGAGVSLIAGHGSHMAQEIDFLNRRLVLNGIGNFLFNSPGRYKKMGVPPFSMMVRITATADRIAVRLYPIHTDNRETTYQPRPVNRDQFEDFHTTALERTNDAQTFRSQVEPVEDEFGHHLVITLGRDGRLPRLRRQGSWRRLWGKS